MAVNLSPVFGAAAQLFNDNGDPLAGGKIYTYLAGTTTPAPTYNSASGSTAHSNPIVLDSAGRVPGGEIWLSDGITYKFVIEDAASNLIGTYDNLTGINSNFVAFTNQQEIQTATAGQTVFNLATIQYQPGTNSLSVFVDGVNQYGPGAQYAYVETDSDTVTFVNGLHVGALVKFTTSQLNSSGAVDAAQVSYTPPYLASTSTNVEAKLAQYVSVKDFGAAGDGVADDTAAIQAAIAAMNNAGGGMIWFPPGVYLTSTGITIGDGTDTTVSTKDNRITLKGSGSGTGTDITNVQYEGATVLRYTGAAASVGVVNIEGPITQVQMFDMQLDCNGAAEFGLYQNHLYAGTFQNINVVNFTAVAYYLTSRSDFPTGCAYGNADNRYIGCYSNNPDSYDTTAIYLTSGVNPATSLNGKPDTARCTFIGGSYIYGGNTNQHGVLLNGADNNTFIEVLFFPASGSSGGYDIYFQQWAGSGNFPLENYFANIGMTRGVSGNGGVGSSYGNMIFPYNTSDGAAFPPVVTGVSGGDQLGRTFVAGVRSYRGRQIVSAESQTPQTTSSTSFVDVTGYSATITTRDSTKLKIEFSGFGIKNTAGEGFFVLNVNGTDYGPSQTAISFSGNYQTIGCIYLLDVNAGSQVVKLKFKSSDSNTVQLNGGVLIVQELY